MTLKTKLKVLFIYKKLELILKFDSLILNNNLIYKFLIRKA
jgi:hypothetical protein